MKNNYFVPVLCVMAFTNLSCHAKPRYEIIDLGTSGYNESYAEAINERGQVIGKLVNTDGDYEHAFFWDSNNGMIDLGDSGAFVINNAGQVAGRSKTANGEWHAFMWSSTHDMIDIGTLGGNYSGASAINNAGQVVGSSTTSVGDRQHAFIWESDQGITDIGTLGISSSAIGINDAGQAVGWFKDANKTEHVFLWDPNNGMIDLGSPGDLIEDWFINDSGQVAIGWARVAPYEFHAFFWDGANGNMTDMGTFGGKNSYASAINDKGQVVGWSGIKFPPRRHAFIWDKANGMVDLGTLSIFSGGPLLDNHSMAFAINNHGQVIGFCGSEFPEYFGSGCVWLWDKANGMMRLEDLLADKSGWKRLVNVKDINDRGQIVGFGETKNGEIHAFLMTPTSEPTDK